MIKRLMKWAAQHSPKGADVIFAAQYGIMECLGMPRYWELVIPIIKQQFRQLLRRPQWLKTNGQRKSGTK